jgi:hypothetical protein
MGMRSGIWDVTRLHKIGSLMTVVRELGGYKLDFVGVQKVRWEKGSTERAEDYTFFCGLRKGDHQLGTGISCIRESYQRLEEWRF